MLRNSCYRLCVAAILALTFTACHRWEDAGGDWHVRRTETLPEAGGGQPYLFRGKSSARRPVLEFTYVYKYYGDDCLGFEAAVGVHFACGDRRPIELRVPGYPAVHYLRFEPEGGASEPLNVSVGPALLFSLSELKKRALAQPRVTSYDWSAPRDLVSGVPVVGAHERPD